MERAKSYYIKKITLNVIIETINYDFTTKENIDHNPNWPQILDHPCRILIIGDSGSGNINELIKLIKQRDADDFSANDKISLYIKDRYEAKYQYLIKSHEKMVLRT